MFTCRRASTLLSTTTLGPLRQCELSPFAFATTFHVFRPVRCHQLTSDQRRCLLHIVTCARARGMDLAWPIVVERTCGSPFAITFGMKRAEFGPVRLECLLVRGDLLPRSPFHPLGLPDPGEEPRLPPCLWTCPCLGRLGVSALASASFELSTNALITPLEAGHLEPVLA